MQNLTKLNNTTLVAQSSGVARTLRLAKMLGGFILLAGFASACTVKDLSKDNGSSGAPTANPISLERHFQRIVHYNCNHQVTSDSIETVKSPTAWVRIFPAVPSTVGSSSFRNQQTGAHAPMVMGDYSFQIDYSYGALNMHVVSGTNIIEYVFRSCTQWGTDSNGNPYCVTIGPVQEQGTSTINVTYTEKRLEGVREIDDCAPPTPTPTPHL